MYFQSVFRGPLSGVQILSLSIRLHVSMASFYDEFVRITNYIIRPSRMDLSAPKYTLPSIRTTGLRTSLGSFNIRSISSFSSSLSFSSPIFLKLGLLKLNISEAGFPWSSSSISARVKVSLKKSRSLISTFFCERNSFALRHVFHFTQQ